MFGRVYVDASCNIAGTIPNTCYILTPVLHCYLRFFTAGMVG